MNMCFNTIKQLTTPTSSITSITPITTITPTTDTTDTTSMTDTTPITSVPDISSIGKELNLIKFYIESRNVEKWYYITTDINIRKYITSYM